MKKYIFFWLLLIGSSAIGQQTIKEITKTDSFFVAGECDECKERIEKAAMGKGVTSVFWDEAKQLLTLVYNPQQTTARKVERRIVNVGHDTKNFTADKATYEALPECCHYREAHDDDDHEKESENVENKVTGLVVEQDAKGNFSPLKGATILIEGQKEGTVSNENGFFTLIVKDSVTLIVSYAGFTSKKITAKKGQQVNIILDSQMELQEVKVTSVRSPSYISPRSAIRTMVMTEKELFKAACCNLSESFETNASVDVSYSDGVTGSKQIQMLGLSGIYSQLTVENLPGPRGIATLWGLNFIPGTWVESIQLSKGVGSVVNGFESITGQINVELKKPQNAPKLFANAYINNMGKTDFNVNLARKINDKWSTALLVHNAFMQNKNVDFNKDGFRDIPTGNLFTILNRWKFSSGKGVEAQAGIRYLSDNKVGGETAFSPSKDKLTTNHYGLGLDTRRIDAFAKIGYVFPQKRYKSFGWQFAAYDHQQNTYFGQTIYDARQSNFYSNLIYQSIIGNTNHKFRTGVSFVADHYDEMYKTNQYKRNENVAGAFFEYTYSFLKKLDVILGIRGDHNNLYGFFFTPRIHVRYQPASRTVIRLAFGKGQRTANIFAENAGVLVSSRTVHLPVQMQGKAYGLDQEVAWSTGISLDQKFRLFAKNGSIGLDFYRTNFKNQAVVDLDKSTREINFYNLDGKSYANSFLAEINYEPIRRLSVRLAYRYYDVQSTFDGKLLERPFVSKHRGFANLAYAAGKWKFDYTITFNSAKRIPTTASNPPQYQLPTYSPSFVLMNAQVSKSFGNKNPFEWYLGGENLTNFYQDKVILGVDQPFGPYFDASMIWGPISGRMFYTGIRFTIP